MEKLQLKTDKEMDKIWKDFIFENIEKGKLRFIKNAEQASFEGSHPYYNYHFTSTKQTDKNEELAITISFTIGELSLV